MFEEKSLHSLSQKHALEVETGSSWGQGTVLVEATEGLWVWFGIMSFGCYKLEPNIHIAGNLPL